jgi:hypothetical protein
LTPQIKGDDQTEDERHRDVDARPQHKTDHQPDQEEHDRFG